MDKWLKNNTLLKVTSFILAIMLWLVVNLDTQTPNTNLITENLTNTYFYDTQVVPIYDEDQYILNMEQEHIKVTLKGSRDLINQVKSRENIDKVQFYINLTDYVPGAYNVPIYYTGLPAGLEVDIQPASVEVELLAKERKEMDVSIEKVGKEENGYQTGEPIIKPRKVHISGAKEQIDRITSVKGFVNIDKAKGPITQQVPLQAVDKNGKVVDVEIEPQTVEVQIPTSSPYTTIPLTYTIINYPQEDYAIESITQYPEEIILYGPNEIINTYKVYNGPQLDLVGLTENKKYKIAIPLEEGLTKIEPSTVEYDVVIAPAQTRTYTDIPIRSIGLAEGFKAEIVSPNPTTSLMVKGTKTNLDNLTNQDIQAFIDLTNLPEGEHEVPIKFNIPLFMQNMSEEQVVLVKITKES